MNILVYPRDQTWSTLACSKSTVETPEHSVQSACS